MPTLNGLEITDPTALKLSEWLNELDREHQALIVAHAQLLEYSRKLAAAVNQTDAVSLADRQRAFQLADKAEIRDLALKKAHEVASVRSVEVFHIVRNEAGQIDRIIKTRE